MHTDDRTILRELAKQYLAICQHDIQTERRDLWRRHNSFQSDRPLIYVRAFAWHEMAASKCRCVDSFLRHYEDFFRNMLFRETFNDDFIFEPYVTVEATRVTPSAGIWGVPVNWIASNDPRGAKQFDPPIKNPGDFEKLIVPHHIIDEESTQRNVAKLNDIIGDIIPINVDRAPVYRIWNADISTNLAYLRGLEQMMWDMMDRPEWLHSLLAFMRDGILLAQQEAEKAGDWTLSNHQNQAMPYAEEFDDPKANGESVSRDKLWCFCASQETTLVGPEMFDEFMLQYQLPIMSQFGLVAYGCCEDLTQKINLLRQIPNLRRIAVAPAANAAKCADQIGKDYILSYRPSPSDMVGYNFDAEQIKRILRQDFSACKDCYFDITLKDVETVQGDPNRVRRWVEIVRQLIDDL